MFPDGLLCANVLYAAGWSRDWAIAEQKTSVLKPEPVNEQFSGSQFKHLLHF